MPMKYFGSRETILYRLQILTFYLILCPYSVALENESDKWKLDLETNSLRSIQLYFRGEKASSNISNFIIMLTKKGYIEKVNFRLEDYEGNFLNQKVLNASIVPYYSDKFAGYICEINPGKCDSEGKANTYQPDDMFLVPDTTYSTFRYNRVVRLDESKILKMLKTSFSNREVQDEESLKVKSLFQNKASLKDIFDENNLDSSDHIINRAVNINKNFVADIYEIDEKEPEIYHRVILYPDEGYKLNLKLPIKKIESKEFFEYTQEYNFTIKIANGYRYTSNSSFEEKEINQILEPDNSNDLSKEHQQSDFKCSENPNCSSYASYHKRLQKTIGITDNSKQILFSEKKAKVLVADRGIDIDHPILAANKVKSYNSIFNSNKEFTDCEIDNNTKNHGTHVAGLITSTLLGLHNIQPVNLSVSYWDFNDYEKFLTEHIQEIQQDEGLDVVNLSIDLENVSEHQKKDIDTVLESTIGVLYVVAAGNDYKNLKPNDQPFLTRFGSFPNVIVVNASDLDGNRIWYEKSGVGSNYTSHSGRKDWHSSKHLIHISAPGKNIISLCSKPIVGTLTGTSQSTAIVSAAATLLIKEGLVWPSQIKARLIYTSNFISGMRYFQYGGVVNVERMLSSGRDKLCFASDQDLNDSQVCKQWYNSEIEFVDANDNKVKRIILENSNGHTRYLKARHLLRLFKGKPKSYSAMYLDENNGFSLGRMFNIDEVTDVHGNPIFFRLKSRQNQKYRLSTLADFVAKTPKILLNNRL